MKLKPSFILILSLILVVITVTLCAVVALYQNSDRGVFYTASEIAWLKTDQININTADQQTLTLLPGIGETLAERIIRYREERGLFRSVDQLKNVSGISDGIFETIRLYITV